MHPFEQLIAELVAALEPTFRAAPERFERVADTQVIPPALRKAGTPQQFLEWAEAHPHWRFSVAEAATMVCAKPAEAAIVVLRLIVEELLEERG